MTPLEIVGVLVNLASVLLTIRRHILTWAFGLLGAVLFGVLFWQQRLYADVVLQVFFFAQSIYGWVYWRRPAITTPITRLAPRHWPGLVLGIGGATALAGALLDRYSNSDVPYVDSLATVLSLTANLLLARKVLDNWLLWIVADVVYVGLFAYKHLWLTAGLYAFFLCLCLLGWREWQRAQAGRPAAATG